MSEQDLDEVCAMEQTIFSMPWTREDFLSSIEKSENIYLAAESNGIIVGYCGLWGILEEGQINNVAVSSGCRGEGVGYEMLLELLNQGTEKGLKEFTLEVREGNASARHLYEKIGFRIEGVRKSFYQNPTENAIIMWFRSNYH